MEHYDWWCISGSGRSGLLAQFNFPRSLSRSSAGWREKKRQFPKDPDCRLSLAWLNGAEIRSYIFLPNNPSWKVAECWWWHNRKLQPSDPSFDDVALFPSKIVWSAGWKRFAFSAASMIRGFASQSCTGLVQFSTTPIHNVSRMHSLARRDPASERKEPHKRHAESGLVCIIFVCAPGRTGRTAGPGTGKA